MTDEEFQSRLKKLTDIELEMLLDQVQIHHAYLRGAEDFKRTLEEIITPFLELLLVENEKQRREKTKKND